MKAMRIFAALGIMGVLSAVILGQHTGIAQKQAAQAKVSQTLCPITSEKINNLNVYADHEGKRVYFCCKGCLDEFKKNPAQTIKGMESKGIILDAAQVNCPVMGEKIDRNVYVDHGGRRIYFCCQGCIDKFNQEPQKYSKKMDQDAAAAAKGM